MKKRFTEAQQRHGEKMLVLLLRYCDSSGESHPAASRKRRQSDRSRSARKLHIADLVAVAAVEKPNAQAFSTSVDLHHAAGETGEVGRTRHTLNTGCWRWEVVQSSWEKAFSSCAKES